LVTLYFKGCAVMYDEMTIGDEMQSSYEVFASDEVGVDEGIPNPFGEQQSGPGGDFPPEDNPPPPPGSGMYQGPEGEYHPAGDGGMYGGPEGEYHPAGDGGIPNPFGGEGEHGGQPPHGEGEHGHPPHGEGQHGQPPHGEGEHGHPPHGEGEHEHPPHGEGEGELRNVMKDAMDSGATPEEAFASVMEAANSNAMQDGVPQEQIDAANGAAQGAFDEAMANGATAQEAFEAAGEAARETMPEHEGDGEIPNPFGGLGEPEDHPMGGHMEGDTPPPHPDGPVNEFIAPIFEGLNFDGDGDSTWNLPISADAVNVEDNSFVISAEYLGNPSMLPPEATDNGDGTYTINSWPIDNVTDNGDGTVTLNVDIGMPPPDGEHGGHLHHGEGAPPPPPPEGWDEPHGDMPPPPPPAGEEGNERGMFDKVMDAAKGFNPFK